MAQETASQFVERMEKIGENDYFRRSVSKDHESKFELWDLVWIMYNNQPTTGKICEINIVIKPRPQGGLLGSVTYKLSREEISSSRNCKEHFVEVEEEKCFSTKEELLESFK